MLGDGERSRPVNGECPLRAWRVRRVGGGNNPDEASVLWKNRTRVRKDERASSTGVWFGGGRAKSWGEEVR